MIINACLYLIGIFYSIWTIISTIDIFRNGYSTMKHNIFDVVSEIIDVCIEIYKKIKNKFF